MLRFYYRAIWEDSVGWQIAFAFSTCAASRKSADARASEIVEWYKDKIPFYFRFKELILTLTETI